MNSMGYKTIGSMMLEMIYNMIYSTLKSIDENILDLLSNPVNYLEETFIDTKNTIISAIQTKIDSISSQQISVFRNKNLELPEEELNKIILTHQIFYSILYQFITNVFSLQILNLSVQEFTDKIESIMRTELEKYNLNISIEDFNRILNKMINVTFINDLIKFLIVTIPNNILKLIISFFPLINTFTVAYNIIEYQLEGFTKLFTGATLTASKMLIKHEFKSQSKDLEGDENPDENKTPDENEKSDENETPDKNEPPDENKTPEGDETPDEKEKQQGGKFLSSKRMNKYNKKYYINRIRKTLKSFYKR